MMKKVTKEIARAPNFQNAANKRKSAINLKPLNIDDDDEDDDKDEKEN